MGYARAGFEVVGVDINPQPHYPFEFHQGDAMTWPLDGFDVIHASPPCQAYTQLGHVHGHTYPDLLGPTRDRLEAHGGAWVIENVEGAPIRAQVVLCGTMFGLPIRRHRWFESAVPLSLAPFSCSCRGQAARGFLVNPYNASNRRAFKARNKDHVSLEAAMGIDWMPIRDGHGGSEGSEAIPPAYTEWIGQQLLRALAATA